MNTADAQCPNCGATGLETIYVQAGVPVHSVVLISSLREALDFPRGDIRLGFCTACTFTTNIAFDGRRMHYDGRCEETQSASRTFDRYQRELASDLIRRYKLRNGRVVEIGCGKGEFLALLCRLGDNRGMGFDPAFVPNRIALPPGTVVKRENFMGQDLGDADLVCCKMTLEHIRETRRFLLTLYRSLAQSSTRAGTPVFFQVPDAGRIYRRRAFWDVYYEHCSYFTERALALLFTDAGFVVEEISNAYGDQYLTVFARSSAGTAPSAHDNAEILEEIQAFKHDIESTKSRWRALILHARRSGRRTVLWGGGSKAVAFLTALNLGPEVDCVVDINERKHGSFLPVTGHRVASPEALAVRPPGLVLVMNGVYLPEVRARLAESGITPRVVALP